MLSEAERLDLRHRVLRGEKLTVEEMRNVFQTLRNAQGAAIIAKDTKKTRSKKATLDDAALDADLAGLGL